MRAVSCARTCVRPIASASAASASGRFRQAEKRAHHERDLIFSRAAAADRRLFDSGRWIFENRQSVFGRGQNRRTARRAEQDRGLVTLHVNDRLQRATIRFVLTNQFREPIANRDQTGRRAQRLRVVDRPEIKRARFAVVCIDNRDAGVAQRSVDSEYAHLNEPESEREKNATGNSKEQTHNPKATFLGQSGDRSDSDRDLKHGHAARKDFVLMKI